jgi:glycosyltransferase involved in cell wall biosynthesis
LIRGAVHLVTCHDLLAVRAARSEFNEIRTRWSGRVLQAAIVRGLRKAACIVCVSSATEDDLLRIVCPAGRLAGPIHPGVAPTLQPMDREAARQQLRPLFGGAPPGRFILHVGDSAWYKNRAGLVAIFARLAGQRQDVPLLVLVGPPLSPGLVATVSASGGSGRVVELADVAEADLAALYSCAELLLFPSLAEGYGWPVLEAMACGCRIVASNRAPIPEIGGDAPAYFDPGDEAVAVATVARVLDESAADRRAHVETGLARARLFSCDAMIDAYMQTYLELLNRPAASIS